MIATRLLLVCLLSAFSHSPEAQVVPSLHPQPSRTSLYRAPSSPHDTLHLYTHLQHGQVQLWSASSSSTVGGAMRTMAVAVPVEASEPASWFATLAPIIGLSLSDSAITGAEASDVTQLSNATATAAAYIVSMKSPTALRHQQLLTDSIAHAGYSALAYLPHNSFLVVPDIADANETAFVEWTLSSPHVQRTQRYAPQNKIDPLIRQHSNTQQVQCHLPTVSALTPYPSLCAACCCVQWKS